MSVTTTRRRSGNIARRRVARGRSGNRVGGAGRLQAVRPPDGPQRIVADALDRPDGGRSFGFTGADLHKNWEVESQRRLVVNGVLWSAKVELPAGGAPVKIEESDITSNMDRKSLPLAKPKP